MRKLARARKGPAVQELSRGLLREWSIELPKDSDSKEERGRVLVIGGEREIPGAVVLAGIAALRTGAGKLQIATCESAAVAIGLEIPEARVVGLEETSEGAILGADAETIIPLLEKSDSVLIGPGLTNADECAILLGRLLPMCENKKVVLDAGALLGVAMDVSLLPNTGICPIITPHTGEMARLMGIEPEKVAGDPTGCAFEAADTFGGIVVLKGPETYIVSNDGRFFVYRGGDVGLATSGSGDTLAGIIAGFAARGADPVQAAVWGVYVHGEAGNVMKKKRGRVGYLARELLLEIPALVDDLSASGR